MHKVEDAAYHRGNADHAARLLSDGELDTVAGGFVIYGTYDREANLDVEARGFIICGG